MKIYEEHLTGIEVQCFNTLDSTDGVIVTPHYNRRLYANEWKGATLNVFRKLCTSKEELKKHLCELVDKMSDEKVPYDDTETK